MVLFELIAFYVKISRKNIPTNILVLFSVYQLSKVLMTIEKYRETIERV